MNEILKRMNEIRARKADIRGQLEQRLAEMDLGALETELNDLNAEYAALEQRKRLIEGIGDGSVPSTSVANPMNAEGSGASEPIFTRDNVLSTPEYRSAWAKTLMRRALTPVERRALDTAMTTTATDFTAPSADADGVNNGGLFIPTGINLALMEEISLISPLFRDAARTAIPGLLKFPYKKSSTGAQSKKETEANTDASTEWADLVLGTSEISETIRVSWRLEAMAVDSFIEFIQNELIEAVRDKAAQEHIYGDGENKMKGVTIGALTHGYTDSALDAIGAALGKLGKKQKIGAKIYVSQSIIEEISFSKDKNGSYIFAPINGAGVNSIATYKVEADPYLNDGDFVIGNVHKYSRMNVVENISLTRDISGKKRANDYTAYGIFGAATQPGTLVYGKKNEAAQTTT